VDRISCGGGVCKPTRKGEVFRDAVRQQATAIVAVHNHPSSDPTPPAADVALTVEIVAAGQLLDIELTDLPSGAVTLLFTDFEGGTSL
jgi:DNA repair protein RadC